MFFFYIDPDVPSRKKPKQREWQHWLVVNIPGTVLCKGETLTGYLGPIPCKGTGKHRYVFLLYKQRCKTKFDETRIKSSCADGRSCFSIADFACKYKMGNPIAGNFFFAKWDCSVNQTRKRLGL
ncbi:putative odorant-binding protein A5 [Ctenocephalides felis]|uniref:putative odorant-binding protein A5 n=1 Tax=Ctenocephalides felis TaxID=7515 RepID=UPI000E6E1B6D|nr:putative odorant-binding protein A5 [Ctenocephalides felis]